MSLTANNRYYKYCIVPMCPNTTVMTPLKVFISVPKDPVIRTKWCVAIGRHKTKKKPLSSTSSVFCCEDHFNLPQDMENFYQYKYCNNVQVQLKLMKNVLPHKFACQKLNISVVSKCATPCKEKQFNLIQEVMPEPPSKLLESRTGTSASTKIIEEDPSKKTNVIVEEITEYTPPKLDTAFEFVDTNKVVINATHSPVKRQITNINNRYYKYCIVPMCPNTTVKTPSKVFISVPKDPVMRTKWCVAIGRHKMKNKLLSSKSSLFCCEDHFNLSEDMEHFYKYKYCDKVQLRIKKNVLPHKFACQKSNTSIVLKQTISCKNKRCDLIQEAITEPSKLLQSCAGMSASVSNEITIANDLSKQTNLKIEVKAEEIIDYTSKLDMGFEFVDTGEYVINRTYSPVKRDIAEDSTASLIKVEFDQLEKYESVKHEEQDHYE